MLREPWMGSRTQPTGRSIIFLGSRLVDPNRPSYLPLCLLQRESGLATLLAALPHWKCAYSDELSVLSKRKCSASLRLDFARGTERAVEGRVSSFSAVQD